MRPVNVAAIFLAAAALNTAGVQAQSSTLASTSAQADTARLRQTYSEIAALPDWSGAWIADPQPTIAPPVRPSLLPKFAAERKVLRDDARETHPSRISDCRPRGMPEFMGMRGTLYEFLFAPGSVVIQTGTYESRNIPTDGRTLPADFSHEQFDGFSTGHWDGDTLVAETRGIAPDVALFPGIDNGGGLRVTERIRLDGPNKLRDDITLENPAVLTGPYTYTRRFTRHREWDVSEYVCLPPTHVDYGVGPKLTHTESLASSTRKPPVRRRALPAPDAATLPGGTWQSIALLPDWRGVWTYDLVPMEVNTNEVLPLKPPFAAKLAASRANAKAGGDTPSDVYHCRPRGPSGMLKTGDAISRLVFTPGQVTWVPENGQTRRIYTDGRAHPADLELSFMGHSIGHWEDQTLVVDSAGFRPDIEMFKGLPSGGHMHLVERMTLTAENKITIDTTLMSDALNEPWQYSRTYSRHRDWDLMEAYCTENNRDIDPKTGLLTFDLTPPPE